MPDSSLTERTSPNAAAPADGALPKHPYALSREDVARAYAVDTARGLSADDVAARLERYGPNRLDEPARRHPLLRFLDQFRSLLIVILIGAAVLAGIVGDLKDAIVIGIVLLINATIGFVMENRAERSLEALRTMLSATARVRRDGSAQLVDAEDVVPGDVVLLDAGDRLPADGRLLVAESVEADESALTGESQPVEKTVQPTAPDAVLAERRSMAYMSTTLTRGRAELLVTASGMSTEVGAIAGMLATSVEPKNPLQIQLDSVGRRITLIGGIAVAIYAVLALFQGAELGELALSAVALAVATVPEGLPAVLALTLALGVNRMAKRGAIVKRLASVEALGAATVICSDKTGTLTLNRMTVRSVISEDREVAVEAVPLGALTSFVLCNDATVGAEGTVIGDPTEGALIMLGRTAGVDVEQLQAAHPRVGTVPFDAGRKWMATLHREDDVIRVHVKGAPDVLLDRCTSLRTSEGVRALDDADRARVLVQVQDLGSQGLRTLASATATLPAFAADLEPDDIVGLLTELTLVALVGITDPPRPEARQAIAECHRAGIDVKMITGDHRDTAAAIARELGIRGEVVTGAQIDAMGPDGLAGRIEEIGVFARVSPEHKVEIVQALTARGHVAAMTGDGVNDAAALRSAHIGVAMGITGTEVTKEAGSMILTDDNFATIVLAVREGRGIYDNIVKFVRFQLSTNIGAILSFLGAAVVGLPAPLAAIQVLWVNIIMDGPPAIALGVDPVRPGIMLEAPRRSTERVLKARRLGGMLRSGVVMAAGTLGVLAWAGGVYIEAVALTMAFTTFVLFQFFNALNARAERETIFTSHLLSNRWLWISFGAVVALQVAIVQLPFLHVVFRTTALTAGQWAICAAIAVSVLLVEEVVKLGTRLSGRAGLQQARLTVPVRWLFRLGRME